jgi:HNH endonuclease
MQFRADPSRTKQDYAPKFGTVWHKIDDTQPLSCQSTQPETSIMKEIRLPCGKVALVSDCDWDRVHGIKWYDRGGGYVRARIGKGIGGDGGHWYLHRFILQPPAGMDVDHIDCNPLNNTRENLQLLTRSRNCMRSVRAKVSGVTFEKGRTNPWRARLRIDGKMHQLGLFKTEEAGKN